MNDKMIRSEANNKIFTRNICNYENEIELSVTYDQGMASEYRRQMGTKHVWMVSGQMVFATEAGMIAFAEYFDNSSKPNRSRPATDAQIAYLNKLGVKLENGLTVERASQLIDAAKNGYLGSVSGWYTDGSN